MCPFIVGPSSLTLVCADIGDVGDVDDGSVYGKETKQCLSSVSSFSRKFLKHHSLVGRKEIGQNGKR